MSKPGITEELPFGPDTLVFKVMGKAFALCGFEDVPGSCNLKCDPSHAEELREKYSSITPGYHMNKKHWNTVEWDGNVPDHLILELIDHSYNLVKQGLPQKLRSELQRNQKKKSKPLSEKRLKKQAKR